MGNSPSHVSLPLDGYMAVRASIEARFSQPAPKPQSAALSQGCCSSNEGGAQMALREQRQSSRPRDMAECNRSVCHAPRAVGPPLPPTLSAAETTDADSDGAADEFEDAADADGALGGRSQSFTRLKAPQVRAPSPLPFPSMASCSPTVSRQSDSQQKQLEHRSTSSVSQASPAWSSSREPAACADCPQSGAKPQRLTAEVLSGIKQQPSSAHQAGRKTGAADAAAREASNAHLNSSDMFCPLSPNSALGSITPTTVSGCGGPVKSKAFPPPGVRRKTTGSDEFCVRKRVYYGPACNHSPFLEGRALQTLLPFLFGPSLGACMGVCVHWFMTISDGLAEMCSPLTRNLEASYGKYLSPLNATLKVQPLQIAEEGGARLDWVIAAKVLPAASGNVLSLGYCFEYRFQPSRFRTSPAITDFKQREPSEAFSYRQNGGCSSRRSALRGRQEDLSSSPPILWPPVKVGGSSSCQNRKEVPTFSVAVAPAGSKRRLWLHRDLCRFHGDETGQAVLTPLGPVCVGDVIEVPVVLSNGIGVADLSTVRWLPLHLVPRVPRVLSGPKAFEAIAFGAYEGCGLELQYVEWFDGDQYRHMTTERLKRAGEQVDWLFPRELVSPHTKLSQESSFLMCVSPVLSCVECMEPQLQHTSTAYSGIDVLVRRSLYSAVRPGTVGAVAQRAWGLQCQVVPADNPIIFPLTRRGLLHDRSTCLQLREGDILESYLTIGGANF